MVKEFINFALDQGLRPQLQEKSEDQPHDVILFDKNDLHFVFITDENRDPHFFQLILPNIDDFISDNENQLKLIFSLTREYKTGKAVVTRNNGVSLSFEQFVFSDADINKLFEQAIGCLGAMLNEYRKKMVNNETTVKSQTTK